MSSNFAKAMNSTTQTWNGATSLRQADVLGDKNGRLSLFFKSVRGLNLPKLYEYLRESSNESLTDTIILAFHIRDCRGGKGERELGRRAFIWLFLNYPEQMMKVIHFIPEYGRWDDCLLFWPRVLNTKDIDHVRSNWYVNIKNKDVLKIIQKYQKDIVKMFSSQILSDYENMNKGEPVSICAKWSPTEKDSLDFKNSTVKEICKSMEINAKDYRKKYISPLRSYLSIVEKYMCENRWSDIDFSKVPSCAMKKLKKSFEKHTPEPFKEWLQKLQRGETDIKAKQLFPHELVYEIRINRQENPVSEAQWKVLENQVKSLGTLKDCICVCDVSGSMSNWGWEASATNPKFIPMDVAIGLSLIISNAVDGPFHNHIITFHSRPTFHVISQSHKSLYAKYNSLIKAPWGQTTNLQATFDLILNQAKRNNLSQCDMPRKVIIFSDMQFNVACESNINTNLEVIKRKYNESGYEKPQIVFWNLNGNTTDFPASENEKDVAMISGFSPSIMRSVLSGNTTISPWNILRETIDIERYQKIKDALN
mgnify:CR=1 FL=1